MEANVTRGISIAAGEQGNDITELQLMNGKWQEMAVSPQIMSDCAHPHESRLFTMIPVACSTICCTVCCPKGAGVTGQVERLQRDLA